jgi:hypothetical protein
MKIQELNAIDDRTFIVVEWNNRFKEEPISGKNSWLN